MIILYNGLGSLRTRGCFIDPSVSFDLFYFIVAFNVAFNVEFN